MRNKNQKKKNWSVANKSKDIKYVPGPSLKTEMVLFSVSIVTRIVVCKSHRNELSVAFTKIS